MVFVVDTSCGQSLELSPGGVNLRVLPGYLCFQMLNLQRRTGKQSKTSEMLADRMREKVKEMEKKEKVRKRERDTEKGLEHDEATLPQH